MGGSPDLQDSIAEDNRALLEIPALKALKVAVFTNEPDTLRPALAAHPQIERNLLSHRGVSSRYQGECSSLDRFSPRQLPKAASIWMEPPDALPFKARTTVSTAKIVRWRADHELAAGLRSQDIRVPEAEFTAPHKATFRLREAEAGPIVVARPATNSVVMGFHPGRSDLRFDLMTPLLFANILRWFEPAVFRTYDLHGGSAGTVTATLDMDGDATSVRSSGITSNCRSQSKVARSGSLRASSNRADHQQRTRAGSLAISPRGRVRDLGSATIRIPGHARRD